MNHYNFRAKCIVCGIEWGSADIEDDDITGALCPECIRDRYTDRIRNHQMRNGYQDCFARGFEDCQEYECAFRYACQESSIAHWKGQVINEEGKTKT
jgi:hypothetical protein